MVAQYGSGPGAAAAGLGVGSLGVGAGDRDVSTLALRGPSSVVGGAGGTGVRATHRDSYSHHGHGHGHHTSNNNNNNFSSSTSYVSSRTRRYNRSHAGGASFVPQNEFPIFSHSGDVEIVVRVPCGLENRYLLHRHILTRCSGFFEASTSQEWSRAQTVSGGVPELPAPGSASKGGSGNVAETGTVARTTTDSTTAKKRWRYELDTGTDDNDIPMLVQKEESSPPPIPSTPSGPPPTQSSIFGNGSGSGSGSSGSRHRSNSQKSSTHHQSNSFFRSVANLSLSHSSQRQSHHHHNNPPPAREEPSQADLDLLRDYDNLFRIMYNYPPTLDPISLPDAYVQCKSLLQLADQYDALAVVGPRVDHHLLQFQSRLWRQIAKYPISYLRLGYLARSKVIFQEALIHVVGQWPAGERSIRAAMPESVVDIIEDKVDELEEVVSRVEARLFRLGVTGRGGERVGPGNGYVDWLAVSLFREWLAENTSPLPSSAEYNTSTKHHNPPPAIPERTRGGHRSSNNNVPGSRARHNSSSSGSASGSNSGPRGDPYSANAATTSHLSSTTTSPNLATLGRTFRLLGGSPKEYLTHDDCKRFLKLSPELYNRDNLRRFEKRIEELKAMAREVVRPLMGSGLELEISGGSAGNLTKGDSGGGGGGGSGGGGGGGVGGGGGGGSAVLGYLTCTTVYDRDLPWMSYE